MKVAISLPDPLFSAAEQLAERLHVSRSQLYASALSEYLKERHDGAVTEKLDAVYGSAAGAMDPPARNRPGQGCWRMKRGEIWWASLPNPVGSGPGFKRPVLVIQANAFNTSKIATVVVAAMTSNLALAEAPGNLRISKSDSGLPQPSVVNVSQIITIDKSVLTSRAKTVPAAIMAEVDDGIRLVLALR